MSDTPSNQSFYNGRNGRSYLVRRAPSVFTSRAGREDVTVQVEGSWGGLEKDGKRYHTLAIRDAEEGYMVRSYEAIPSDLTVDRLRDMGWIGGAA